MSDKPVRPLPGTLIPSPRTAVLALLAGRRGLGLAVVTAIVATLASLTIPAFATHANVVTMLADASVIGIAAIGLFLVMLSGGVDLSIGAVATLAPLVGGLWTGHAAAPVLLLIALASGAGVGLVSGLLIVGGGIAAFAATLAIDAMVRGGAGTLTAMPDGVAAPRDLLPALDATILGMPASLVLLAVIAALAAAFLSGFRGGRILVAVGSDRRAARAAGLNVFVYGVAPYVASGILAAVAGLLSAAAAPSGLATAEWGGTLTLDTFVAVVVGGTSLRGGRGSLPGALCGVALVVMVRSALGLLDVAAVWQGLVIGALLLGGLLVDRLTDRRRDLR